MGTYLNKPVTDKKSEDMENDRLLCGASSMQGWREAQEDAHNCILDYDKKVSLFAVYDGHGGAEVAQYASCKLPAMVQNKFYENQEFEKALRKAYLDFDDSLIKPSVVDELTALREECNDGCDTEDDEKVEELTELYKEAKMPLEEIINKYKNTIIERVANTVDIGNKPGSSKESSISSSSSSQSSKTAETTCDNENDKCGSSSSSTVEGNSHIAGSSSSTRVNGTSKNGEQNKANEPIAETSEAECGPSSSNGQNGSGPKFGTACLIGDDSEDSDDSDDEIFEAPNPKSLANKDDSESDSDDDDDDEDDENVDGDDDDDTNLLYNADYDADDEEKAGKDSGCTAVMALLVKRKLFVANAGDSRCVVSIDGKAHDMSKDHKPEDDIEIKRIRAAGGRVSSDGRVNGGLNLSRALGDHNYKKNANLPNTEQMITALPDLSILDLKPINADFIVLACDGIWNSLSSQEVVDFISERINKPNVKLSLICEELFDKCLAPNTLSDGTGCDNMTCIIVKLKPKKKRAHSVGEDNSEEITGCKKFKIDPESEISHEHHPGPVHESVPVPVLESVPASVHVNQPESGNVQLPEPVHEHQSEPVHVTEIRHPPKPDLILDTEAAHASASVHESKSVQ